MIYLYGKVIPIVDLRIRYGRSAAENTEHTRIIASVIENNASAAEEFSGQAMQLKEIVSQFKLQQKVARHQTGFKIVKN